MNGDLLTALGPVADAFDALGVRFYVGGSVASSAHGVARASLDADVIADLEPQHVDPLVTALGDAYYVPLGRLRSAVTGRTSCNVIHIDTMFKIDIFVSKNRPFDRSAESRAKSETLGDVSTREFPVSSPEDVVLAKLEWFRKGGETSERQWWDVLGVLKVTPGIDRAYLERWAAELGLTDVLRRALTEAGVS
jgi:hypothetical protein